VDDLLVWLNFLNNIGESYVGVLLNILPIIHLLRLFCGPTQRRPSLNRRNPAATQQQRIHRIEVFTLHKKARIGSSKTMPFDNELKAKEGLVAEFIGLWGFQGEQPGAVVESDARKLFAALSRKYNRYGPTTMPKRTIQLLPAQVMCFFWISMCKSFYRLQTVQ